MIAGWGESSAYIPETGIVYWTPVKNGQTDDMLDGMHVREITIPETAQTNTEVTKHVVLEGYIVWISSASKIYACAIGNESEEQSQPTHAPFEVPGFAGDERELKDIQGSFHKFGVFTSNGEVLAGNVDYLRRCASTTGVADEWSEMTDLLASRPQDVPALQHAGIIGLAYGDHHYHALNADGKIFSFGVDSQMCGQLGLSGVESGCRFRGLRPRGGGALMNEGELLPVAERRGRQVWFEPEKKDWLSWMESCVRGAELTGESGHPAVAAWTSSDQRLAAFSEWIEQEGRHWQEGPTRNLQESATAVNRSDKGDYEDLDAYFAIGIAAAGWHSGALVLVDEDKAHEIRSKWISLDHASASKTIPGQFESTAPDEEYIWKLEGFPKVQLANGYTFPGLGEPRPWRDGRPTVEELGLQEETS